MAVEVWMRECVRSKATFFFQDWIATSPSLSASPGFSVKIRCYPTHETFCSLHHGATRPHSANNHAADAALLALCGGVDCTARWKRRMRVCAGPARNRRSGPHPPGEDGTTAESMAPPRGSSAQWTRRGEESHFFLCGTQIQLCMTVKIHILPVG